MLVCRAAVAGLAVALVGVGTGAAHAERTSPPGPGGVVVSHAARPTLTAIGRTGLLATAARADGTLVARAARVEKKKGAPAWGRPVTLGRIDQRFGGAQVALNRRGVGAVAWTAKDRTGGTAVRLRSASGTWSKAYRIPHTASPVYGVAVNKRGTVAVVTSSESNTYPAVVAIHRPGGSWQIKRLTAFPDGPTTIAVAPDGSVYLGGAAPQRGAYGSAGFLARISPRGQMTQTRLPDDRVESVQVLATPDGHVDLVIGQAHTGTNEWESTADGETYWATHYSVRSRLGATGGWTTLWDHDGVVAPQATLDGNDVRLTWTQYADPTPNNTADYSYGMAPRRLELRTTEIGASASDPDGTLVAIQATRLPTGYGGPSIAASTAAAGRCLVIAWRTGAPTQASRLSSTFDGRTTRTWPDAGPVSTYEPEAATACVAGHGYLARTAKQVLRDGDAIGGKVRVETLG